MSTIPLPIRELQDNPALLKYLQNNKETVEGTADAVTTQTGQISNLNATSTNLANRATNLENRATTDEANLADHIADTSDVHGATGRTIGRGDTATEIDAGVVLQAAAVADLTVGTYTVSNPPTQAQVQAIAAGLNAVENKVNALLASLRTAGQLAP